VDESDILAAARRDHGLHKLDEIDYAVIERTGAISIIPKKGRAVRTLQKKGRRFRRPLTSRCG
jgi:uncharacterized membrane protein YcaP (DUF421 family)